MGDRYTQNRTVGLGEAGTPAASYQEMLMTNTCTIVSGLGGTCDEAVAQAFLK